MRIANYGYQKRNLLHTTQCIDDFKLIEITKPYAAVKVEGEQGELISRLKFKVFGDYNHSTVLGPLTKDKREREKSDGPRSCIIELYVSKV